MLHGFGIFVLPVIVATVALVLFETAEVVETLPAMGIFTLVVLFPVSLAQLLGVVLKSRRDLRFWRQKGELGFRRAMDVLHSHVRVITLRGWSLLGAGLLLLLVALGAKWASFGLLAVLGLFLFYLVVGWTIFVSTFLIHTFERGLGQARTGIDRAMRPAVVLAGEPVEEVFTFQRVPVPWGYYLVVEDPLPARLHTESRYVVGASASGGVLESRSLLKSTPRGHFFLGPARIWYADALGITRVSVASVATAEVKVLPRFRRVEIIDPPRTPQETPDMLTRPHRYATDDFFRFREYAAGDDTRRIHWRLSMKTGRLQVRRPESREINTQDVLLVLDTWLPKGKVLNAAHGADDILDGLVDAWLGIARELIQRGDRVTLVAACSGHERGDIDIESLEVRKGQSARWQDLGARARWQGRYDVPDLLAECGDDVHGVVVTARFTASPPGELPGQTTTWLFLDPSEALGPPEKNWFLQVVGGGDPLRFLNWLLRLPHPAGSEDNALPRRIKQTWDLVVLLDARRQLRRIARTRSGQTRGELMARGDAVYRIDFRPTHIVLVGLQAARK